VDSPFRCDSLSVEHFDQMRRLTPNSRRPRVALLIESSRAYGRGLLLGVAKYVREHGPWSISLQEQSLSDATPEWLKKWKGDGIITRVESRGFVELVRRLRVPVVYVRNPPAGFWAPTLLTDHAAAARMVFEHLRERGFLRFGFCGFDGADYSDARKRQFMSVVEKNGMRCHVFENPPAGRRRRTTDLEREGMKDGERVAEWIRSLPKPVGLMACNDMRGQQVLEACRAANVSVPDEVVVVGMDNDEVLCDLSDPTLSSVVPDTVRVGCEAAALLDELMAGKEPPTAPIYIEPKGIQARRSTEVLAIDDRKIAMALRFIRERACDGIDVSDLLRAVPMSRSTLERRFIKVIGRAPKDEIIRVRLNQAKQLLTETSLSVEFIAEKTGFSRAEYFSRIFKKKVGTPPLLFRSRSRSTGRREGDPLQKIQAV